MGNIDWHYAGKLLWKVSQGLCVALLTVQSILHITEIKGQCHDIAPSRWSELILVKKALTYTFNMCIKHTSARMQHNAFIICSDLNKELQHNNLRLFALHTRAPRDTVTAVHHDDSNTRHFSPSTPSIYQAWTLIYS